MVSSGQHLRMTRDRLGLSLRDVEAASRAIVARHRKKDFLISPSGLSNVQTKGTVPSAFRMYSLAVICQCNLGNVLSWFGIDVNEMAEDTNRVCRLRPHEGDVLQTAANAQFPA